MYENEITVTFNPLYVAYWGDPPDPPNKRQGLYVATCPSYPGMSQVGTSEHQARSEMEWVIASTRGEEDLLVEEHNRIINELLEAKKPK